MYSCREDAEWRGSGVGFRPDCWAVMRKKQSSKGVWLRLRRICDGAEKWCGSTYLRQGAMREIHATEIHAFVEALPPTTPPVVFGGDMNTPVRWAGQEGTAPLPTSSESKGDYMLGYLRQQGFGITSPAPYTNGLYRRVDHVSKTLKVDRLTWWGVRWRGRGLRIFIQTST